MNRRVVITAIGIASPLGIGKKSFLKNCLDGEIGINECKVFQTEKLRTNYFGCIPDENLPYLPKSSDEESRTEAISWLAARELLDEIGNDCNLLQDDVKTCFCFGTLLGHTPYGLSYAETGNIELLAHCYDFIPKIRNFFKIKGGSYISSAACASGTTAAGIAFEMIKNGIYERAIIGGADPISEVSAYGFHSLKNLSPDICNPFDENRNGINIGEGSAFLFAETLESAKKRNAEIYGEISGYGLNNDAYHITSPDPDGTGAYLSMSNALKDGNISIDEIQYINAHGTGTTHNDIMEIKSIDKLFSEKKEPLYISSLKGQIGHCMGASGVLELAALLLSMKSGMYMPQPSIKNKLPEGEKFRIQKDSSELEIKYALSNSFAFAGNTASILVKKYGEE